MNSSGDSQPGLSHYWGGFAAFLLIGVFFLWTEHRAHLLGTLPYVILVLCPLILIFMHRGRSGNGGSHES